MNKIVQSCRNYFHAFQDLKNIRSTHAKSISILKILSYFTVAAPLAMGITYGVATLVGRVKKSCESLKIASRVKKAVTAFPKAKSSDLPLFNSLPQEKGASKEQGSLAKNPPLMQELEHSKPSVRIEDSYEIYQNSQTLVTDQIAENLSPEKAGTRTRKEWIEEAKHLGLGFCDCTPLDKRLKIETLITAKTLESFPVETTPKLTILSFGSGYLLQDYLLLQTLANKGYKEIHLDLVDRSTSQAELKALNLLVKSKMLGVYVHVHLYSHIIQVPTKSYNFAFGIDLDVLLRSMAKLAWLDLGHVFSKIDLKGFCYLNANEYELLYDFKKIPETPPLVQSDPYRIAFVSCGPTNSFFSSIFCRLLELRRQGQSKFDIYFFSDSNFHFEIKTYDNVSEFLKIFNSLCDLKLEIQLKQGSLNPQELEGCFDLFHYNMSDKKELDERVLEKTPPNCKLVELFVNYDIQSSLLLKNKISDPGKYYRFLAEKYNFPLSIQRSDHYNHDFYKPSPVQ